MANVLHYVQTWLPMSAGFVHGLVHGSRHPAVVVARDPLEHTEAFPHDAVHSLRRIPRPEGRFGRRPLTLAVSAMARRHRADVVHVHFGYAVNDVLGAAGRLDLPVVLSLHGEDVTSLPARSPNHYDEARRQVAAVIVPSEFLAGEARSLGFAADRIHVIPAGVDTTFFRPTPIPATSPAAVFVGRLVEKKGLDVLLEAWPSVRGAVPDATLDVIGSGPLQARVEAAGDGVRYCPPDASRRRDQVREAITAAHLVVQPSRTAADGDAESLLIVNLEGQASGRPVVSTRHGGIPEFVEHGRTGILVPEGDVPALADAMIRVFTDRALAEALAGEGPALAARFDVAACTARVDELYEPLVRRRVR